MASSFNLTAQLNLRGPANLRPIIANIKRELKGISTTVSVKLEARSGKSIDGVTDRIQKLNAILVQTKGHVNDLNAGFKNLSTSLGSIQSSVNSTSSSINKTSQNLQQTSKNIKIARTEMEEFGKQSFLAIKRFAAFSIPTNAILGLTSAITSGFSAFIRFDKELVKLQQVTGKGSLGIKELEKEITRLATTLGVSSESLTSVASTLAQAGLSAQDTKIALEALAKTELAPSFDNLTDTTEGAIAALRQFELQAGDLESALGSINAVAAAFAVESKDIISAIQRTGGVFASASKGVSEGTDALNEFIAIFTSVRQTTRESAETIATGLRTIFTRIQRSSTIDLLKQYGVELRDLENKFVGPFEAVKRLSDALSQLDPRAPAFAKIVEELGGFRQIGKVIPLIQQFSVAQQALGIAQKGQSSLTEAQVKAQQSLANQIAKVREQFLALIRDVGQSTVFQGFFKIVLGLTSGLIGLASAFKPILPILGAFAAIKGVSAIGQFASGFFGGLQKGGGAGGAGRNIGESISGAKEKQKAEATSKAADALRLNTDALRSLTAVIQSLDNTIKSRGSTTFATGGKVLGFNRGGLVPGSGNKDSIRANLTPGEFVMRKGAVKDIGAENLSVMNNGGTIQKLMAGSPGGVKRKGIDWKNLNQGRGKKVKKGARSRFDLPQPGDKDYLNWVNQIYAEYDADPSLPRVMANGILMPPEIAYAEKLISQEVFERGGSGMMLGYDAKGREVIGKFGRSKTKKSGSLKKTPLGLLISAAGMQRGARAPAGEMQKLLGTYEKDPEYRSAVGLTNSASIQQALSAFRKSGGQSSLAGAFPGSSASKIKAAIPQYIASLGDEPQKITKAKTALQYFDSFISGGKAAKAGHATAFTETVNQILKSGLVQEFAKGGKAQISDKLKQQIIKAGGYEQFISQSMFDPNNLGLNSQIANFGMVGLRSGTQSSANRTENRKLENGKRVRIHVGFLQSQNDPNFRSIIEDDINKSLQRTILRTAGRFGRDIDASIDPQTKDQILDGAVLSSAVGSVFESALQMIGAPYLDKIESIKSMDFPFGLGTSSKLFGSFPNNIPTDATRTIAGSGKGISDFLGQINRFFTAIDIDNDFKSGKFTKELGVADQRQALSARQMAESLFGSVKADPSKQSAINSILVGDGISGVTIKQTKKRVDNLADQLARKPETIRKLEDFLSLQISNNASGGKISAIPLIKGFASGGTVPAMVSSGEAFVPPKLAKKIGYNKLNQMNQADKTSIKSFAGGGISIFKGAGSGTSDSIGPIGLPSGSFIIREKATRALGLHGNDISKFALGGSVDEEAFLEYKARKEGVSVKDYIYTLSRQLGRKAYEISSPGMYQGRAQEMKYELAGKQDTLSNIGSTIQQAQTDIKSTDPAVVAAATTRLADAQSRLAIESENIAREMKALNPSLDMNMVEQASKDIANLLSNGELAKAQDELIKALGKAPEGAEAMNIAMEQAAKEYGISVELLKNQFGAGGPRAKALQKQAFAQSREGQRFGMLSDFVPGLEGFSKTTVGRGLGSAADFISGKGGKTSQLFSRLGGISGIGAGIAIGSEGLKQFLPQKTLANPNVAGVIGGLTGAGAGAATGATLGSFAGPIGTLIGGVGGAIIGGIKGFFSAQNTQALINALDKVSESASKLDSAFKVLEKDSSDVNYEAAQKAFGNLLASSEQIRTIAFSPENTNPLNLAAYTPEQRAEAINTVVQNAQSNVQSAAILSQQEANRTSTENLSKALKELQNNTISVLPTIKTYQDAAIKAAEERNGSLVNLTDTEKDKIKSEIEAQAAIEAYSAQRKQSGATEQQINKAIADSEAKVIEEGKKIITQNDILATKQRILERSMSAVNVITESLTDVFRRITAAITRFNQGLDAVVTNIENRINDISGNASISRVRRDNEQILSNIAGYSVEEVQKAAGNLNARLGGTPEATQLTNTILASKEITDKLPTLLRTTKPEDASTIPGILERSIASITQNGQVDGAIKEALDEVSRNIEKQTAGDQQTSLEALASDSGFIQKISDILSQGTEVAANLEKARNDALDKSIDLQNKWIDVMSTSIEYSRKAALIGVESQLELKKTLGQNLSLDELNAPFTQSIGLMTGGITDPGKIADTIKQLQTEVVKLENERQSILNKPGGEDSKAFKDNEDALKKNRLRLNDNINALKRFADSTDKAANILNKIQEQQGRAKNFIDLVKNLATGGAQNRAEFIQRTNALAAGRQALARGDTGFFSNEFNLTKFEEGLDIFKDIMLPEKYQEIRTKSLEALFKAQGFDIQKNRPELQENFGVNTLQELIAKVTKGEDPASNPLIIAYKDAAKQQQEANIKLAKINEDLATNIQNGSGDLLTNLSKALPDIVKSAFIQARADVAAAVQAAAQPAPQPPAINAPGAAMGGMVDNSTISTNGQMVNFKPKGSDKYPFMLAKGEAIISAAATKKNRGIVGALLNNEIIEPGYAAKGGIVTGLDPDITLDADKEKLRENINAEGAAYAAGTSEDYKKDKAKLDALEASYDEALIRSFYFSNPQWNIDDMAVEFAKSPYGANIPNWNEIAKEKQEEILAGYRAKFQQFHDEFMNEAKKDPLFHNRGGAPASFPEYQKMRKEAEEKRRDLYFRIGDQKRHMAGRGREDTKYNFETGKYEKTGTYYDSDTSTANEIKENEIRERQELEFHRKALEHGISAPDNNFRIDGKGNITNEQWQPGEKEAHEASLRSRSLEAVNKARLAKGLPPLELPADQIDPEKAKEKVLRKQKLADNRKAYLERQKNKSLTPYQQAQAEKRKQFEERKAQLQERYSKKKPEIDKKPQLSNVEKIQKRREFLYGKETAEEMYRAEGEGGLSAAREIARKKQAEIAARQQSNKPKPNTIVETENQPILSQKETQDIEHKIYGGLTKAEYEEKRKAEEIARSGRMSQIQADIAATQTPEYLKAEEERKQRIADYEAKQAAEKEQRNRSIAERKSKDEEARKLGFKDSAAQAGAQARQRAEQAREAQQLADKQKQELDKANIAAGKNAGIDKVKRLQNLLDSDPAYNNQRLQPVLINFIKERIAQKYSNDITDKPSYDRSSLERIVSSAQVEYYDNQRKIQEQVSSSKKQFAQENLKIALEQFAEGVDQSPIVAAGAAIGRSGAGVIRSGVGYTVAGAMALKNLNPANRPEDTAYNNEIIKSALAQGELGLRQIESTGAGLGARLGFGKDYKLAEENANKRINELQEQEANKAKGLYTTDESTTLGQLLKPENIQRAASMVAQVAGEAGVDAGVGLPAAKSAETGLRKGLSSAADVTNQALAKKANTFLDSINPPNRTLLPKSQFSPVKSLPEVKPTSSAKDIKKLREIADQRLQSRLERQAGEELETSIIAAEEAKNESIVRKVLGTDKPKRAFDEGIDLPPESAQPSPQVKPVVETPKTSTQPPPTEKELLELELMVTDPETAEEITRVQQIKARLAELETKSTPATTTKIIESTPRPKVSVADLGPEVVRPKITDIREPEQLGSAIDYTVAKLSKYASSPENAAKMMKEVPGQMKDKIKTINIDPNLSISDQFATSGSRGVGGSYSSRRATLSFRSKEPSERIMVHELTHGFQDVTGQLSGGAAKKLGKNSEIMDFITDPEGLEKLYIDLGKNKGATYSGEQIIKEPRELLTTLMQYEGTDAFQNNKKAINTLRLLVKEAGYNKGGMATLNRGLPMSGIGPDNMLAAIKSGEFIVNDKMSRKHLGLLHAINNNQIPKFYTGGQAIMDQSSGGSSFASGPTGGYKITMDDNNQKFMSTFIDGLNNFSNSFNTYIDKLSQIKLPEKIELTGNYQLQVQITGAAALEGLDKRMKELAVSLIEPKLEQLRNEVSAATGGTVKPSASLGKTKE